MSTASEYDRFPYESHPFHQSQPSHLSALATLFGMTPPDVQTARVLELGCASGGNILPLAQRYPDATFVGIDFSVRQIEQGLEVAKEAGLGNIELIHGDIAQLDDKHTDFDYVICHGVYSWVPDSVQHAILRVCRDRLTSQGISYISYNVYPGWHMRGMIRDMMLYHTAGFEDPVVKVAQARGLLDFMATNTGQEGAYRTLLDSEVELLRNSGDYYLRHEHLSEDNSSVYFHEFVERASTYDLQYVAESELATMISTNLAPAVAETLSAVAPDILRMEQYMDFLRNRTFRQTLLTHATTELTRHLTGESIRDLHLSANLMAPERNEHGAALIKTNTGAVATTGNQIIVDWTETLRASYPCTTPAAQLMDSVGHDNPVLGTGDELRDQSASELIRLVGSNVVQIHGEPINSNVAVSEQPRANPLVRAQVVHGDVVCNFLHQGAKVDELGRQLLQRLTGEHSVPELVEMLVTLTTEGVLNMQRDGEAVSDTDDVKLIMSEIVPRHLQQFANLGLLEA
jgi:methyltransferase-like protein